MLGETRWTYAEMMEGLAVLAGASVSNAGLITLLSSAEAFAARLQHANQQNNAMATVQLQALSNALVDLRTAREVRQAAVTGYVAGASNSLPPGAPVVT